jgi:hypothetical protein
MDRLWGGRLVRDRPEGWTSSSDELESASKLGLETSKMRGKPAEVSRLVV